MRHEGPGERTGQWKENWNYRQCPAGLQAAATLLQLGYEVDIYEKGAKAGGFLRTGIPEYRLPDAVVDTEVARIAELGANFLYCREVGKDVSMEERKEIGRAHV